MEADLENKKIVHQQYTIQFSNKAINNLKWNKQTEIRQRIKIRFKNGPRGVSMRWTPKTNKKVFQLIFIYNGKTYPTIVGSIHLEFTLVSHFRNTW